MSYARREESSAWDWRQLVAVIVLALCTPLFFVLSLRKTPDLYSVDIIPLLFQLCAVVIVVWCIRYYNQEETLDEEAASETQRSKVKQYKTRTPRQQHPQRMLSNEVAFIQQQCASVNTDLVASSSWADVLAIVERKWTHCDDVNFVTALYRIAVLRPVTEAIQDNPVIHKILVRLHGMVHKSEIRCLSNLVWALAKIPVRLDAHTDLLSSVALRSAELIRKMREKGSVVPPGLCSDLKGFPRESGPTHSPTPTLMTQILRRLQQFNNLLWGFATLRYGDFVKHPSLITNVNAVFVEVSLCPEILPLCNAQEVACIAWAYSRALEVLQSPDVVSFLRELALCAGQCLGSDSIPRNISMFAWAFHQMKEVLTHQEMETLLRTLEKPMAHNAAESLEDRGDGKVTKNAAESQMPAARFHPPTSWKPHQIGLLLMTYAEAKVSSAWFAFFVSRIVCTIPAFRPIDYAYVSHAYAVSGVHDPRVFSNLYEGMKYRMAHFSKNDVQMIKRAFTIAEYKVQDVLKLVAWIGNEHQAEGCSSR